MLYPGRQYPEQNKPTRIQRIPSHAQDECHHRGGQDVYKRQGFKFGMQGKMGHEMSGYVFNARAATEEYAHERTDVYKRQGLFCSGYCLPDTTCNKCNEQI